MSALCAVKNIQAEFLKETGRNFSEWQHLLLSVQHETPAAALALYSSRDCQKAGLNSF